MPPEAKPPEPMPQGPDDESRDDAQFASLFSSVSQSRERGADVSSPDRTFLDRLRQESAAAFLASTSMPAAATSPASTSPTPAGEPSSRVESTRKLPMFLFRALAAGLLLAAGIGYFTSHQVKTPQSALALGEVLDAIARADSLHLAVTLKGQSGELWTRRLLGAPLQEAAAGGKQTAAPLELHWDMGQGKYEIARDEKAWLVDEPGNRVTATETPAWLANRRLELLKMLGLPATAQADLAQAMPAEEFDRDGRTLWRYRLSAMESLGRVNLEVLVDAANGQLASLEAVGEQNGQSEQLAQVTVLAMNQNQAAAPADKFVVKDTLTEDGRVGKVTESQGIVSLRPMNALRWTPVCHNPVLKPGDWLRTDLRGGNAVSVRLVKDTRINLGPGTLLEIVRPDQIRVSQGEFSVTLPEKDKLQIVGPDQKTVDVKGTQIYRVDRDKLVTVAKKPLWLAGFEGATANESLGSLVAKVDGRDVPLTVGYHKVTVDIRDQIARTVVEESFINHTKGNLEGVFYFPLPDDASISGFGMWIGEQLVEADVVEKERAREIYETILRERRDPGLLEWSGGNLFKARVFPIFPGSEKRIKITYTQVLPLRGNRYRYSYALQSELLKQNPLRELAIDVRVNSTSPLAAISSPSHNTRNQLAGASGRVEFSAQEYTPTRDFEVVVDLAARQSDVVVIPHRRGDDGYFMLQLSPPGAGGDWQREILPDGNPIDLLVLADTSASLDRTARNTQAEFIAALLGSLSPKDTFNLAGCDVDCAWAFSQGVAADPKNIAAARAFLAKRRSLGWTDLDTTLASALKRCKPGTQVVYVGDGIITTGDADPVAFAQRLRRLYSGAGTFHAVAVSSLFESVVLKSIASLGGGSVRKITQATGPQATALELLNELAQPALKDLKVEFRGVRVARVYPEELANVAAGSQQILLGRYLPEGKDQKGEVIVTGTLNGKPVRYASPIGLADAESGNSFIPRLWARQHLDLLLAQGTSESIKEEIVALSEEYHIMTPYTSLLVLETDADRERFKVKRRFQMRDGEKFFAGGRDNAAFDLTQQQMKRAGDWRIGLRRSVLRQLGTLGRDPQAFELYASNGHPVSRMASLGAAGYTTTFGGRAENGAVNYILDKRGLESDRLESLSEERWATPDIAQRDDRDANVENESVPFPVVSPEEVSKSFEAKADHNDWSLKEASDLFFSDLDIDFRSRRSGGEKAQSARLGSGIAHAYAAAGPMGRRALLVQPLQSNLERSVYVGLFPEMPPVPSEPGPIVPKADWPADVRELVQSLLRIEKLRAITGGVDVERVTENFNAQTGELELRATRRELYSPAGWLTRSWQDRSQTTIEWCDKQDRGIWLTGFQLGRQRASTPADLKQLPFRLTDSSMVSLERLYRGYKAVLERPAADRARLVLSFKTVDHATEIHVLVDTVRNVILTWETMVDAKVTSRIVYSDFVEVAGSWWAQKIETFAPHEAPERVTERITQKVQARTADELAAGIQQQLAGRQSVQFLKVLPTVSAAKRALASGKATFEDHYQLLLYFTQSQQWERVAAQLEGCEKMAEGKPGLRWLHFWFLSNSRRGEELRLKALAEAARLAAAPAPNVNVAESDEFPLAIHLGGTVGQYLEANEAIALLEVLGPLYQRQPARLHAMLAWQQQKRQHLNNLGQFELVLAIDKEMAERNPVNSYSQTQYAQTLAASGDYPAAFAWLEKVLAGPVKWPPHEEQNLRQAHVQMLLTLGRYADAAAYLTAWIERVPSPTQESVYDQYLSALIRTNQLDKLRQVIALWMQEGRVAGKIPPATLARLMAALRHAVGQTNDMWTNTVDERWHKPLAETVRFFARHETYAYPADYVMGTSFSRTDEARLIRKEAVAALADELEKLSPEVIQRYVQWGMQNDPAVETATWKKIAAAMEIRWSAAAKGVAALPADETDGEKAIKLRAERDTLGSALSQLLKHRIGGTEWLAFLREQLRLASIKERPFYVEQLMAGILEQPWTAELEGEAFSLLKLLAEGVDDDVLSPAQKLTMRVAALHRLTDRMIPARQEELDKKIENPEKLTRLELRAKREEIQKLVQREFAERLQKEIAAQPAELAPWLAIERLDLVIKLAQDLPRAADDCWEKLGPKPLLMPEAEHGSAVWLESILRERYLSALLYLATRQGADKALADRVVKYVDEAIELERTAPKANADPEKISDWKLLKYQLLVALDRPVELQQALEQWLKEDTGDLHWQRAMGYLLAERGNIPAAIEQFQSIERSDELGPAEYRALAGWYLAANQREPHERALIGAFKTRDEYQISRMLYGKLGPWQRGSSQPVPSELDPDVLRMFAALFEKSNHPRNYLSQLQQFYQASRDFRLLTSLADATIGHTAGEVYPFLTGMQSVLGEIRDEATADEVLARLALVRQQAKTTVDQRALDLLELLVERRSSEVLNQPGPHVAKALAALERAGEREWLPGEPRYMAEFLNNLGKIAQAPLAAQQIRLSEALYKQSAAGSLDRLYIGYYLAGVYWNYERRGPAIDLLQSSVTEYQQAVGGKLPQHVQFVLDTWVDYLEQSAQYAQGEKILQDYQQRPANRQQGYWLTERLYQLYRESVAAGGTTSLGKGQTQYASVEKKLRGELDTPDDNHRYNLASQLAQFYRTAHDAKLNGITNDLRAFCRSELPAVLLRQNNNAQSIAESFSRVLHDLASPRDALAFLIERIENEPAWLRYRRQDGWNQFQWQLGQWRGEVKELGDLEPRLLAIVLDALRRDLENREDRNRSMFLKNSGHYWAAKEADFLRTAEEVYEKRKTSGASVRYIADYLYQGLHKYPRAIEILLVAHRQGLLDEASQRQLVIYLHERDRYGESIALLQPMVELRPDTVEYRTLLMHAYFKTNQQAQLRELLKTTDTYYHEKGQWTESVMAALATSCLENELFEQSVTYYLEAIPQHQRTQPRGGVGNDVLWRYYEGLAKAYVGLKKTPEAVDAASGAIVSWGFEQRDRSHVLGVLNSVLDQSPDLDAYVKLLDQQTAETGLANPIVRKALGLVYSGKGQFAKAVVQLREALALQANDAETHKAILFALDQLKDESGAIEQLLATIDYRRRDIALFEDLGRRLGELKDPAEAERAYTSIVEVLPTESESHTLLAEIRQRQNRWAEAAHEWEQVARIRSLEPTGLLGLAAAQVKLRKFDAAEVTLKKLQGKAWPARFENMDQKIRELDSAIVTGKKG